MTFRTIVAEIVRLVVRIGGAVEIARMARVAIRGRTRVLIVDMAGGAICGQVGARQREGRIVVIECRWTPGRRGVANCTIRAESGSHVIRVGRAVEVA